MIKCFKIFQNKFRAHSAPQTNKDIVSKPLRNKQISKKKVVNQNYDSSINKLGTCKNLSFCASRGSRTQRHDGKSGWSTQIQNNSFKVEEDFNNGNEGRLFRTSEEWSYMQG